jgi:hypothetical protein
MKNKTYFLLGCLLIISALFFSCSPEDDANNNEPDRDKFLGEWVVNDDCSKATYKVQISADPNNSIQVLISNFLLTQETATAIVAGSTITVQEQTLPNDWTVSGSGVYSTNEIDWSYNFSYTGVSEECTATFTK